MPEPYVSNVVVAAYILNAVGADDHADDLMAIGTGERRFAAAFYEPGERHNPLASNTTATRSGDGWVLNGHKAVALGADTADAFIISADADGSSLFMVPADADGVTVRKYQLLDGRGAADIVLNNVVLPSNALLGETGKAKAIILEAVDRGTAALVADSVGAIEEIIEMTKDYLRTRTQFGRPIGTFQVLAHRMVDLLIEYEQAKSMSMEASVEANNEDSSARQKSISAAKAKVGAG